jgi:hypothetical protein
VLEAMSKDGRTWNFTFRPAASAAGDWDVHLALLGGGISSKIGAGENSGRNLEHDFVVLVQKDAPLKKAADGFTASLTSPSPAEKVPRQAVAVWVTHRDQLAPVQAAGGWLAAQ